MMIAANRNNDDEDKNDSDKVSGGKPSESSNTGGISNGSQPSPSAMHELATAADVALYSRALKSRWPIKDSTRRKVMNELQAVALHSEDRALRVKAASLIIAADKVNIEAEKGPSQHLHLHGGQQAVQVIFSDDWYGSKAANAAASDGSPAIGSDG